MRACNCGHSSGCAAGLGGLCLSAAQQVLPTTSSNRACTELATGKAMHKSASTSGPHTRWLGTGPLNPFCPAAQALAEALALTLTLVCHHGAPCFKASTWHEPPLLQVDLLACTCGGCSGQVCLDACPTVQPHMPGFPLWLLGATWRLYVWPGRSLRSSGSCSHALPGLLH